MILRRIRLENYRGIDKCQFNLPDRGVTIIEGPNEIGKSSLLLALRQVFKRPDSTTASEILDVVPVHKDAGPEIEVEVETGPYHFTYLKRFVTNKVTELTVHSPNAENLTGRPAHDRVEQILKETLDSDLWDALQVHQGTGLHEPNLTQQEALSQALDRAAGTSPVGETEIALFAAATDEYEKYFTVNTGRARAPLVDAKKALEEAAETVADLAKANNEIEKDIGESARLLAQIRRLGLRLPELAGEERKYKDALVDLERREGDLGQLVAEAESARLLADLAEEATRARERLILEETERRAKLKEIAEKLEQRRGPVEDAERTIENARAGLKSAEETHLAAIESVKVRRTDREIGRSRLDLDQLRERRERIDTAEAAAEDAKAVLATNQVTEALLDKIRNADIVLGMTRDRLNEGGPSVRIRATRNLDTVVDGTERSLSAGEISKHAAADELIIELPGIVEIQISPGSSTQDLREAHEKAHAKRDELLEEARVNSLEEAAGLHQARRKAEQALAERDHRVRENLRDLDLTRLDAKILDLDGRIARFDEQQRSDPPPPENFDQAKELFEEAEEALTEATGTLASAKLEAREAEQRAEGLVTEFRKLESDEKVAASHATGSAEALAAARAMAPDESVARDASRSKEKADRLSAKADESRSKIDELAPDTIRLQHNNAVRALENGKKTYGEIKVAHATVEGRIATRQDQGLFEELERARAKHLYAERELEAVTRRSAATRLLFSVLDGARREAHQAYVGPLQHQIESLAKIVFGPDVRIELDENLKIRSRTLAGRTLEFRKLSMGTQEQLGLMARLAVGMLVAEQDGAPVILDDTLGYTDPIRLKSMGAMLAHAGASCQIVVLTCTPGRFDYVGSAKTLRFGEALEEGKDES